MTTENNINNLYTNLENCYKQAEKKGAKIPQSKNFDNLANTIKSITGGTGGGGVSLNIEYTETEPQDITKLWVKAEQPEKIFINKNGMSGNQTCVDYGSTTAYTRGNSIVNIGNDIYIIYNKNLYVYNILTNETTKISLNLTNSTEYMDNIVVVDKKIYMVDKQKYMNVYDSETNILTDRLVDSYYFDYNMKGVVINKEIYYITGTQLMLAATGSNNTGSSKVVVYNTENNTISQYSTTIKRCNSSIALVGSKIYVIGGQEGTLKEPLNSILIFDTETKTYTYSNTVLPVALINSSSSTIGTDIYIFGGTTSISNMTNNAVDTVYKYDTTTDTLTLIGSLDKRLYNLSVCNIDDRFYIVGGIDNNAITNYTVYQFTDNMLLEENFALIKTGFSNNTLKGKLINSELMEMFIYDMVFYKGNELGIAEVKESKYFNENSGKWEDTL